MANELGVHQADAGARTDPVVIDLGDDFQPVETPTEVRIRNRRGRRAGALVTVALAAILGLTAAGAPRPDALTATAQIDVDPGVTAMVVGDTVYVVEVRRVVKELTAYRLDGGHRLWSTRLRTAATGSVLYRAGSTILVSYTGDASLDVLTDGVDLATGRLLWRSASALLDVTGGRVIMSQPAAPGESLLAGIDPVTGTVRWSAPVGDYCYSDLAEAYAELCPATGTLRVLDLDTGAVRATRRLNFGAPSADSEQGPDVALSQTAGVVIAGHQTATTPVLEGFSATDLTPLWSQPFFPESIVADCGTAFCMYDSQIGTGVDPRTGAGQPFPGYDAMQQRGLPIPDTGAGPVQLNTRYALIPLGARPDHDGTYPGASALIGVPDSAPVRVPSATPLDTFIASVNPATGHMTILDRLHDVGVQSCAALGTYLACEKPGSRLEFWRLPG